MNIICVLHVSIIKLEKTVNGSEKSSGKEPEDTQDSKGQVRWDMRTAHHSRDLDSIAGSWPHVHPSLISQEADSGLICLGLHVKADK